MSKIASMKAETLYRKKILLVERHLMVGGVMAAYMEVELNVEFTLVSGIDEALNKILQDGQFSLVLVDIDSCTDIDRVGIEALLAANGIRSVGLILDTVFQGKIRGLINLKICGVLLKSMAARSAVNILRLMLTGESFFPAVDFEPMMPSERVESNDFTASEAEILALLAAGKKNREIAQNIGKAEATVKMHVGSLMRKLKASNRTMAVMQAKQLRLI